jgi:hypothetical protein
MVEPRHDAYRRLVRDYLPAPIGMTALDLFNRNPGPTILNNWDLGIPVLGETLPRDPAEFLARGLACGIDRAGFVRHIQPGLQGFVGFIFQNLENAKVYVKTQGALELMIPGLSKSSIGKTIFAVGPNTFSFNEGLCVGRILYINPERADRAMVVFQRFDSPKKIELDLIAHSAKFI